MRSDTPQVEIAYSIQFERDVRALSRRYRRIRSDLEAVLAQLLEGERPGDRVRGTDREVYKVRARNSDAGRGKRGGYRLIYLVLEPGRIVLISAYFKSEREDISADEIRRAISEFERSPETETTEPVDETSPDGAEEE